MKIKNKLFKGIGSVFAIATPIPFLAVVSCNDHRDNKKEEPVFYKNLLDDAFTHIIQNNFRDLKKNAFPSEVDISKDNFLSKIFGKGEKDFSENIKKQNIKIENFNKVANNDNGEIKISFDIKGDNKLSSFSHTFSGFLTQKKKYQNFLNEFADSFPEERTVRPSGDSTTRKEIRSWKVGEKLVFNFPKNNEDFKTTTTPLSKASNSFWWIMSHRNGDFYKNFFKKYESIWTKINKDSKSLFIEANVKEDVGNDRKINIEYKMVLNIDNMKMYSVDKNIVASGI